VVLGHLDGESGKVLRIVEIARAGAFVGVDRCGHETTTTADQRVELLTLLRAAGVLGHVLLSHDAALRMVDRTGRVESDNPFLRIDRRILPRLRENGFTDRDVDQLLRSNPERFFGIAGRGEGNDEYERGTVGRVRW
jgi:phosphotriesterase-related protein